ncbi:MAG: HU family DNA-binding protein [Paludibacteraceae bacterium]|nr:HU family DNA-binding protein [Paludibacteraceae bacterium]
MEQKMNWSALRQETAKRSGLTQKDTDRLMKAWLDCMKEALQRGEQIHLNELGTFRIQDIAPRKSVDVNTGEAIIIEGYKRLTFDPSNAMKDSINETDTPHLMPDSDPIQKLGAQAEEIIDILGELGQGPKAVLTEQKDEHEEEQATPIAPPTEEKRQETEKEGETEEGNSDIQARVDQELEDTPIEVNSPDAEIEKDEDPTYETEPEEERDNEDATDPVSSTESQNEETEVQVTEEDEQEIVKEQNTDEQDDKHPVEEFKSAKPEEVLQPLDKATIKKGKPKRLWLTALITFIIFCILLGIGILFMQHKMMKWIDIIREKTGRPTIVEVPTDTISVPLDTAIMPLKNDSVTEVNDSTIIEEEVHGIPTVREYTEFLATEDMHADSRLAWMAYRYYGKKDLWVFIYEANRDHLTSPSIIPVGTEIRIPKLPEEWMDLDNPDNLALVKQLAQEYLK